MSGMFRRTAFCTARSQSPQSRQAKRSCGGRLSSGDGAAPLRKKTVEVPPAVYEDYRTVSASWKDIVAGEGRLFSSVFRHSTVSAGEEGIEILFGDPYYMRLAENREKTRTVASILAARFGKQFKVRLRLLPAGDAAPEVVSGKRIPGIDMDIEEE